MQDRVPTKPNRALVTPEDGRPAFYATITRADEPTQEGTPLNKRTLLTDETAALFELNNTAVPDDAFKAIGQNFINGYPQIGDLRYSVLESIDDKWLRCDGSLINDTDYPVLFERLHGDGAGRVMTETNDVVLTDVVYGDGYTVAYTKGGACTCYVTSDPSKDWTPVTITSNSYSYFTVCYDDGLWVAFAVNLSGTDRVYVWTTTNPTRNWTQYYFDETQYTAYNKSWTFEYKNKTFLALAHYRDTEGLGDTSSYATKSLTSTWVRKPVDGRRRDADWCVAYGNDLWVAVSTSDTHDHEGLLIQSILDPTDESATWNVDHDDMSYTSNLREGPFSLVYFSGYWVLSSYTRIYISTNLANWVQKVSLPDYATDLAISRDKVYCVAGDTIMVTTDPSGTWTEVQLPTLLVSTYAQTHYGIAFDGDGNLWTVGQETWKLSNSTEGAAYPTFYTEAARKLPNIEVDAAYSYIRAK